MPTVVTEDNGGEYKVILHLVYSNDDFSLLDSREIIHEYKIELILHY